MSTFTTEVRTICEQFAGMNERTDADNMEAAIGASWRKIFGENWNTHDPSYKEVLCSKILRHYWMREIGGETVGLWLHWLRTRMGEIMPYYNELYKSALIEFNPMHDYELNHKSQRINDGNTTTETEEITEIENTTDTEGSNHSTNNRESTRQNINKFNDTPQGQLTNVLNGTYLTNATVDDATGADNTTATSNQTGKVSGSGTTSGSTSGVSTVKNTEDYTLTISGKTGGKSYSKLLTEFRETLLNIDMMIINDLSDLFMGLWA